MGLDGVAVAAELLELVVLFGADETEAADEEGDPGVVFLEQRAEGEPGVDRGVVERQREAGHGLGAVGEVGVGDVGQAAVARGGENVLDLVDRDGGAGVVGVELDDLAAVARAVERRVDAADADVGAAVEVDAAVHEAAVAVVECPVELAQLHLAAGERDERDGRGARRRDRRESSC